jgi:hypothetical protein
MRHPDKWTTEQENLAKILMAAKVDNATFLEKVGRTKGSAYAHFSYVKHGKPLRRARHRLLGDDISVGGASCSTIHRPTEEMIRDARQRSSAPRPLTAWLNGDPPPGQSALDKKHAESHTP